MSWDPSGGLARPHGEARRPLRASSTATAWAALVTALGCCVAVVGTLVPWAEATATTRLGDVFGGLGGDDLVVALNTGTLDGWDTLVGKLILGAAVALVLCVQASVLFPAQRAALVGAGALLGVALAGLAVWAGVSVLDGGSTHEQLLDVLRSRDIFSQLGIDAKDPRSSVRPGVVVAVAGCGIASAGAIVTALLVMVRGTPPSARPL